MKELLYLIVLTFSFSVSVKSQPIRDTYLDRDTLQFWGKVSFTDYGDKFFFENDGGSQHDPIQIVLTNYDGSIFKTFTPVVNLGYSSFTKPGVQGNFHNGIYQSISNKLFDNDTVIEFLGYKNVETQTSKSLLYVVNEFGNIEYTFPDTVDIGTVSLFKFSGGYKMGYEPFINGFTLGNYQTYSLPGSLPCNQCDLSTGLIEPNQGGSTSELKVYPNPFNNSLEINYNFFTRQDNPQIKLTDILGRELKSIPLNNQSDKINLNTSDLQKGTIVVSLLGGQNVISKKSD